MIHKWRESGRFLRYVTEEGTEEQRVPEEERAHPDEEKERESADHTTGDRSKGLLQSLQTEPETEGGGEEREKDQAVGAGETEPGKMPSHVREGSPPDDQKGKQEETPQKEFLLTGPDSVQTEP